MWILGKHEEKYILQNSPDVVVHLEGGYGLIVYETKIEIIKSETQKRDVKMLDGSLRRADTFLIDWDEEAFSKENFGQVKWT